MEDNTNEVATNDVVVAVNELQEAVVTIADAVEKITVEIERLKEISLEQAKGLDEVWECLNKDVFEPFEGLAKRKEIELTKQGLSEKEGLDEYIDFYNKIYDGKDFLEDIASEMVGLKAELGEGEDFDEDAFVNEKLKGLDNSMVALGLKDAIEEAEKNGENVEVVEEPQGDNIEPSNEELSPEELAMIEQRKQDLMS